jgi:hypothetical protein
MYSCYVFMLCDQLHLIYIPSWCLQECPTSPQEEPPDTDKEMDPGPPCGEGSEAGVQAQAQSRPHHPADGASSSAPKGPQQPVQQAGVQRGSSSRDKGLQDTPTFRTDGGVSMAGTEALGMFPDALVDFMIRTLRNVQPEVVQLAIDRGRNKGNAEHGFLWRLAPTEALEVESFRDELQKWNFEVPEPDANGEFDSESEAMGKVAALWEAAAKRIQILEGLAPSAADSRRMETAAQEGGHVAPARALENAVRELKNLERALEEHGGFFLSDSGALCCPEALVRAAINARSEVNIDWGTFPTHTASDLQQLPLDEVRCSSAAYSVLAASCCMC